MHALGWVEGSNISIEVRLANGDTERLLANAAAFAVAKVDVIVAFSGLSAQAARKATSTIPIVMDTGDPIRLGLATSLARPGGNVTGVSWMALDLVGKQLAALKEAVPQVSKIGVLMRSDYSGHSQMMKELEGAAAQLGLSLLPVVVNTKQDLPHRFDEMTAAGADGYFVFAEPRTEVMLGDITALASRHRLPGAAQLPRYAEAGVLLAYGINLAAIPKQLAVYVDKILKGAKPGDLPIEQPTSFKLTVNLKTAKALDLTISPSLLTQADELIE
jgi:putative tryptophan/tyrosine transport system substrate-binding protein